MRWNPAIRPLLWYDQMHAQRSFRFLLVFGIVLLAATLRLWSATRLPVDFDEPDYVQAGYGYAAAMAEVREAMRIPDPRRFEDRRILQELQHRLNRLEARAAGKPWRGDDREADETSP